MQHKQISYTPVIICIPFDGYMLQNIWFYNNFLLMQYDSVLSWSAKFKLLASSISRVLHQHEC